MVTKQQTFKYPMAQRQNQIEIIKYFVLHEYENTCENLWNAAKSLLRVLSIVVNTNNSKENEMS